MVCTLNDKGNEYDIFENLFFFLALPRIFYKRIMYQIILNKRLDTYFIRMNILLRSIGDYLMQTLKIKTFASLDTSEFQVIFEYSFYGLHI